ncbi:MAG: PstS family phosphate ABC transporter substrate-binding protein [Gammaproteobacteria bacterium]|nr:PstS family phosphate ABC transporter substrate-binding protein [Gammaproteobacteria bacterium]
MAGLIAAGLASSLAWGQVARDYISIVGSSTVYPFATVVAEQFGRTSKFRTPKIESTGSGGGIRLFCAGVGVKHPDVANSSRRIKSSEVTECAKNGVREIVEIKIGYDGIVFASSVASSRLALTRKAIFLALARQVPDPKGGATLITNPYRTWRDVDPALPDRIIEVLGPPPTSGTRDAFVELAMEGGCKAFPWIAAIKEEDEVKFKGICQTIREDGRFIEAGENDNLIVQKLKANPNALGIFGYSFLEQNEDAVQGATVDGQAPAFQAIASGAYPVSRPLFFYVKKAHVGPIPGLREFLAEFTSNKTMGAEGYLSDKGLIPLPAAELSAVQQAARDLAAMGPVK